MERTKTLLVDFTGTNQSSAELYAYCGDINSNVLELETVPEIGEDELLLCSFIKDGVVFDTLVIKDNRLVLPPSVMQEEGNYSVAFAVADLQSRLTASAALTVSVAADRLLLAPTREIPDGQSFVSYLLALAEGAGASEARRVTEGLQQQIDILSRTGGEAYSYAYSTATEAKSRADSAASAASAAQDSADTALVGAEAALAEAQAALAAAERAQATAETVKVGSRNYYSSNTEITLIESADSSSGKTYYPTADRNHDDCENGLYLVGSQDAKGAVRLENVITSNGDWTVSFWIRGSQSTAVRLYLDICGSEKKAVNTSNDNSWTKVEYTATVTDFGEDNAFVRFSNIAWAYFFIKDIKVEKGSVATDWTPAPEDIVSETKRLSAEVAAIKGSTLAIASGDWELSEVAEYACVAPVASWLRIGQTVFFTFGFYSYGSYGFELTELPFACGIEVASVPLCHTPYSKDGVTAYADAEPDLCYVEKGSKTLNILRKQSHPAVLSGTLIYRTDEPFPETGGEL